MIRIVRLLDTLNKPIKQFLLFSSMIMFSSTAFAGVDLILNNDDLLDPVSAGGISTYEIRVTNDGADASTGTTVVLDIPANTNFVSATGTGLTCGAPVANQITCDLGTLAFNSTETKTITLELETTVQGNITVVATASSDVADDVPADNTASQLTTVNQGANLQLIKSGPASAPSGSNISYSFTVTNNGPDDATDIQITDPIPTGFSLISVPAGCSENGVTITCDIASITNGNNAILTPVVGQLTAASGSTVTNSASATTLSGPADPDTNDNTSNINTSVTAGSDMFIAKSRDVAGSLLVGDTFNFIIAPGFTGDAPNNITVTDVIPAQYSIDTGSFLTSQNGWSCNVVSQTVTCTKASGGGAGLNQSLGDISIPVQAIAVGTPTNTTNITAASPIDSNPGNNTANDGGVTIDAPIVDLGIVKSGPSPALTVVGVPYNYNFDVTNNGSADFTGPLTITENLPANLTLNSIATTNGWTCLPATGAGPLVISCDKDPVTINAGDDAIGPVLEVVATSVGSQTNSASISTSTCNFPADPNNCLGDPADDTSSFGTSSSTNANSADISIIKTAAVDPVAAGEIQTYTLEIVNTGPNPAGDVEVLDIFRSLLDFNVAPTGAGYISETVTENSATLDSCVNSRSGNRARRLLCTFTTIPICTQNVDCPTIDVQVRQSPSGNVTNTATANSQVTADPNTSNNSDSVITSIDPRADVFVSVTDTPDPIPAGQALTYVITASNLAPSAAGNVTITDTLPPDVTFVSATPASGSCSTTPVVETTTTAVSNNILTCNLGTLAAGSVGSPAQQTVTVIVRPNTITQGTTITYNTTVSTTTTEVAGGAANNSNSTTTDILQPSLNLIINKSESVDPVAIGDDTVYTIVVNNDGPSTAENVIMTDTLPATLLSYQSISFPVGTSCPTVPVVGDDTGAAISCNLGNIVAGDSVSIDITMRGEVKGIATNTATVSSDEVILGFESNALDNTASQNTTVRNKADMEVFNKQAQNLSGASITSVNLREDFQFLIQVRNNTGAGLSEADEVTVNDNLPAGMELTGTPTLAIVSGTTTALSCTGMAGDTSFSCDLGTVSSGGEINIIAPVQIVTAPAGDITNTASVDTTSRDIVPANNSNTGAITSGNVITSSIAGRVFRDFNNNGNVNAGDTGLAGITITISGNTFDGAPLAIANAVTDANGDFIFTGLPASDGTGYTLTEAVIVNSDLLDGIDTAGSLGGNVTVNDVISGIVLPDNTAAINYLFAEIAIPRIGLAKSAGAVTIHGDGTFSVTFTMNIENAGGTPLSDIEVNDNLAVFGSYTANAIPASGEYTISAAPTINNALNNASLTANAGFTGSGANQNLLTTASSSLPDFDTGTANHSRAEILFSIRFFPTVSGTFNNTAIANAISSAGQNVTDNSVDGTVPDFNGDNDPTNDTSPTPVIVNFPGLNINKTTGTVTQTGPLAFDVPFTITITNAAGGGTATFVQIIDDLTATFPTAQSFSITSPATVSACTGTVLTVNALAYDGDAQPNILSGTQNLLSNEQCQIDFTVNVDYTGSALPVTETNTVDATTANSAGGAPTNTVTGSSDVSFGAFATAADIDVTKSTGNIIQLGLRAYTIPYTIVVKNNGNASATFVQVTDNLAATFPTAQSVKIHSPATISACSGTVLNIANPPFDGISQTKLLDGTKDLLNNEQCQIDFSVDVDYGNNTLPATQTNTAVATTAATAGGTATDTTTDNSGVVFGNLASVSGRVWRDNNHDRLDNNEPGVSDFIVEVLNSSNQVIGSAITNNNGEYSVSNLLPSTSGDPDTLYSIRFIDQQSGAIFGLPVSNDPVNANGTVLGGNITGLSLSAGVNTINQSLPLDPSGIIYDSRTRQPIADAQITIEGPAGFNPALHLVGGSNNLSQTTGADGFYQYLLLPTAPVGTYTLSVKEPAGYLPGGSRIIPACSNTLNVSATPDPLLVHSNSNAPALSAPAHNPNNCASTSSAAVNNNASTQYYLSFVLTAGVSANVVNNHIPLDIISEGALTLIKSTPKLNVIRSELVPYTIVASNNFSETLNNIDVVDQIPPGFKYKTGSGRMAGVALEPSVNGRTLTWPNLNFSPDEQRRFNLLLIVGGGVNEGEYVNQAWATNNINSQTISNIATATVRVIPDPTFDCSDIIGKVFDDKNLNGYPDDGEEMLPGIRLATARGWIVTTDNYGRYHITCAAVPHAARGSNFIIKLDERSLPSGYRITTENPRVVRLTRGKLTKANFGAAIHRVVRLDIAEDAFELSSSELKPEYINRIDGLLNILKEAASVLRISYLADYETQELAEDRLQKAKSLISERWQAIDCCYNLILEEEIHWRTGEPRLIDQNKEEHNGGSN